MADGPYWEGPSGELKVVETLVLFLVKRRVKRRGVACMTDDELRVLGDNR